MKPLARIRLRLLGRLALTHEADSTPIRLSTRKAGGVLAYLALSPEQTATREQLATLLWGGCSDQQARQSLRQALVLLRKELGEPDYIVADSAVIRLQPGRWMIDAVEFEELSKSFRAEDLDRAAGLFGGEFLSGINIEEEGFGDWLREQRQRAQLAASRLCETFALRPDLVQDGERAMAAAARLLALDPLREDWHRVALTLAARYRGKNEALAQADAFTGVLQRELGVVPEKETRALVETIRAGGIAAATTAPSQPADAGGGASGAVPDTPQEAFDQSRAPPQIPLHGLRPARWRPWLAPSVAAGVAMIALVLGGGWLGLAHNRQQPHSAATSGVQAKADLPQSPQPSSQPASNPTPNVGSGVAAIMVVPFTAAGEGNEQSILTADLMSDDLTNLIGRVGGFRVISRHSAASYRGQRVDPVALGKTLGVRYFLEGSVEVQGERLRTRVDLIDATRGQNIWSARYDRSGADLQVLQEEVVRSVGRELQIEVTRLESSRDPQDLDAHTLIYKGWAAISEAGREGAPALERAEKYFAQVLAREPNSTRAMTGLAAYHIQMAAQIFTVDPAPHLGKAEMLLTRAVEIRPDVGGPSRYMGTIHMARGRPDLAIPWFEREIDRNPGHPSAYAHLGRALVRTGKPEEGLNRILYAVRLSPRDPEMSAWLGFAGVAEIELAHYDKAVEYLDRSLALQPKQPRTLLVMAAAHALRGNLDAARLRLDEVQKSLPHLANEKMIARLFGTAKGPGGDRLAEGLRLALGPAADLWASPRPSTRVSGEAAATADKAIIPILVLPLKTFGESDSATELFAEMVTDDLTNLLSRVQFMRVISRQTALTFKGQAIDVAAVGADLHVRYVLDGSLRIQGDKLRVNIELIDPKTRLPVWSTRIEREAADRYGVEDELVGRLARELQFEILPIESARRANDSDVDALVYQGWNALYDVSKEGYRRAESFFRLAAERDPHSLAAQIGLGAYHARIGALALDADSDAHRAKALELLHDAVRRDPQSGTANFYIGLALNKHETLSQSIEYMRRAIELNPSFPAAYAHIGHGLSRMGKPAEGIEYIHYAMRLSPRDPTMAIFLEMAGNAELELGRYGEAADSFSRATVLRPRYPRTWAGLAAAQAFAGRTVEARDAVRTLKMLAPVSTPEALLEQFGRHQASRLRQGLAFALAADGAGERDMQQSAHGPQPLQAR